MRRAGKSVVVGLLALSLIACSTTANSEEADAPETSTPEPTPERVVSQWEEVSNTCVDALDDEHDGHGGGFDIEEVSISKSETFFTVEVKAESIAAPLEAIEVTTYLDAGSFGGGSYVRLHARLNPIGEWHLKSSRRGHADAVVLGGKMTSTGRTLTIGYPIDKLDGMPENFEWSVFVTFSSVFKDFCPEKGESDTLKVQTPDILFSDFAAAG